MLQPQSSLPASPCVHLLPQHFHFDLVVFRSVLDHGSELYACSPCAFADGEIAEEGRRGATPVRALLYVPVALALPLPHASARY
jgi:hypothetical protein